MSLSLAEAGHRAYVRAGDEEKKWFSLPERL